MDSNPHFAIEARGLWKTYTQGKWWQKQFHCRALEDVNFALDPGSVLAVTGESGSGKTTLAMCLVGLEVPDAGEVLLNGINLHSLKKSSKVEAQRQIQLIFQDSAGALNPRMSAIEIVEEPLLIRGECSRSERSAIAERMLESVGVSPKWKHRLPREFSGGQRQRLAIARALVLKPSVLILDEIFVGLDLSIRGQIANLLLDIKELQRLSYICISHDLALVSQFADTVAVMDRGRIVAHGKPQELLDELRRPMPAGGMQSPPTHNLAFGAHSGA
jgi:ABC-type dipeptide/oligopeptide/nickel transport system ATPase subunit